MGLTVPSRTLASVLAIHLARSGTIQPISFALSFAAVQASERKCGKLTMLLSSCTFLPEKALAMSRWFFVFSYTTLKLVPGIVTMISSSKTSTIIFDL